MSFPMFFQILTTLVFAVGFFVIFARLRRPAKDDPRLSKGLQLLSSKIAVLEDLSDRTEHQVQQMLNLLDQKSKELQSKISLAEQQVAAVRQSMNQSLEVAQIFQDKIPHNEIIERQNSVKYIKAARLAHAGVSVEDIARDVDLPMGEIEFIAKVNQESLSFREEDLPAWAREPEVELMTSLGGSEASQQMPVPQPNLSPEQEGLVQRLSKLQFEMQNLDLELAHRSARNVMPDMTRAFETPRVDSSSLERIGEEFRRAVEAAERTAQTGKPAADTPATETPAIVDSAQARADAPNLVLPWMQVDTVASAPPQTSNSNQPNPPRDTRAELEAARAAAALVRDRAPQTATSPSAPASAVQPKIIRRVEFPRI